MTSWGWDSFISWAIGTLVFLLPVVIHYRRRSKYKESPLLDGPLQGTLEDLERAERELAITSIELREKLLVEFEPLKNLETFPGGYSQDYVMKLVSHLNANGVRATHLFQQSLPAGVISAADPHGHFEIFVERGAREKAIALFELFQREH